MKKVVVSEPGGGGGALAFMNDCTVCVWHWFGARVKNAPGMS